MLESTTVVSLLLWALNRVNLQEVFDRDPYESRREALPGARLVKVLVLYQMIRSEKLRGLIQTIKEHAGLQALLGGAVARNTLSNALAHRDLEQMIEAWMLVWQVYGPWLGRMGRKFARLAVVDASLIKLSLLAYSWAEYREAAGAAKMTAVLDWARGIPQQLVVTTGKVHDLRGAAHLRWARHWTYIFDRAYLGFDFLTKVLEAGAHFVVRFKDGIQYRILERFPVAEAPASAGLRLRSDWTISLPGWEGVLLRLVSYQLPDGKLMRVLTDRFDLSALSVAQLYKERWTIEEGFRDAKWYLGFAQARVKEIEAWSRLFALFAISLLVLTTLGMALLIRGGSEAARLLRRVVSRRSNRCELSLISAMTSLVQQGRSLLAALSPQTKLNLEATL